MRLARALDEKKMDVRLRDKLVTENKISKDEVKQYFSSLADQTDNSISAEKIKPTKSAEVLED